ncbi:MAG: hypothetical protein U5P41_07200 [Gammaproteobacteria bacterium]|nr:hypothetical protein [Gammaproteobacteria bacterium]
MSENTTLYPERQLVRTPPIEDSDMAELTVETGTDLLVEIPDDELEVTNI